MRLTSRKKRSAIVVILFRDFAFDVAIFLASYIIEKRADFLGRQQHVAFFGGIDHSDRRRYRPLPFGKRSDRPQLAAAITLARKRKATATKLDRLSRSVAVNGRSARSLEKELCCSVAEIHNALDRTLPTIDNELRARHIALDLQRS
jgi:hypothetical protein